MIAGQFHEGSGLGDQLFRYITVRTLAEEKGYKWGMYWWNSFKGLEFLSSLDYSSEGKNVILLPMEDKQLKEWLEKDVRDAQGNDIRSYDPEINFIEDNTIIDGSFEDDKYWGHNLVNIDKWLQVEPVRFWGNECIVGFRGGEYASNPDLFLPKSYYDEALSKMRAINSAMQFEVHTDDPILAGEYFVGMPIVENIAISHSKHQNMGFNWRSARYAKYAIIPNSAFFIIPRLLKHLEDPTAVTIAPRYWARHNTKVWARPACYYKQFTYI